MLPEEPLVYQNIICVAKPAVYALLCRGWSSMHHRVFLASASMQYNAGPQEKNIYLKIIILE